MTGCLQQLWTLRIAASGAQPVESLLVSMGALRVYTSELPILTAPR